VSGAKATPKRTKVPHDMRIAVLTEAGYMCAVPRCGQNLTLDIHHVVEVSKGGGNTVANQIPLCPTCHAKYHRGMIAPESIRVWKGVLQTTSSPYDRESYELLHYVREMGGVVRVSGDGALMFRRLIVRDMVTPKFKPESRVRTHPAANVAPSNIYELRITEKGKCMLEAWLEGRSDVPPVPPELEAP
jgi:hypothetical protein